MRILITGGAGFIGSNLCRRLLSVGHHVICMDNFNSGLYDNIKDIGGDFTFIQHDVREPYDIECDWMFNLACPASPKFYQKDPLYTMDTCYLGMKNALDNSVRYGARLLQASTSEVYGQPLESPQNESYFGNVNPFGERSCYDEGKRIAESMLYGRNNVRIVRIFNTYGEFMRPDDGRVISNFVCQAIKGNPITIYGDGNQTRSFQYISDLIDGMILVMKSNVSTPINIGNPEEISLNELVGILREHFPDLKTTSLPMPSDDPLRRKPDITKASSIGYEPKVKIREGLERVIHYFQRRLGMN